MKNILRDTRKGVDLAVLYIGTGKNKNRSPEQKPEERLLYIVTKLCKPGKLALNVSMGNPRLQKLTCSCLTTADFLFKK